MKNLVFVNGTMGAGKSTVARQLRDLLAPAVYLDGDWCWDMQPFVVNDETKAMVMDNIAFLLNRFLRCTACDTVVFCWVMHQQAIVDELLARLERKSVRFSLFTLTLSEQALIRRLRRDIEAGLRSEDVLARSCARLPLYETMNSVKIDVSQISAQEAAAQIAAMVRAAETG